CAVFTFADKVREGARPVIDALHAMGIQVIMITGDAEAVARTVAEQLGIDRWYARVLPDQKAQIVRQIRAQGLHGAFVGDGINDAPAL
ncbi:HAD-IC family P-type ATPase, partial [Acinetobacter baumannii]